MIWMLLICTNFDSYYQFDVIMNFPRNCFLLVDLDSTNNERKNKISS